MHVVLYQPEIPPNVGNIARLCAATNTTLHLVGKLGFIVNNRHYQRAGLDYWEFLNLETHETLDEVFEKYPKGKVYYLSTKATKNFTDVKFEDDDLLVFGPETRGLPENMIFENPETAIKIPMFGNVRSLNISNSVAIVLYEGLRQIKNF